MVRRRRQPQRTCIACREVRTKRELVRIVRTPEGQVMIDPTGKMSGRGAYLCRSKHCWEVALRESRIQRALKVTLSEMDRVRLERYVAELDEEKTVVNSLKDETG